MRAKRSNLSIGAPVPSVRLVPPGTAYSYPATLEPDEDGRLVVHFPGLPEALTDGADEAEALREAADCLSEALASRIVDGEEIPAPAPLAANQHLVSPDPTIALKVALYEALCEDAVVPLKVRERGQSS